MFPCPRDDVCGFLGHKSPNLHIQLKRLLAGLNVKSFSGRDGAIEIDR